MYSETESVLSFYGYPHTTHCHFPVPSIPRRRTLPRFTNYPDLPTLSRFTGHQ